MNNKISRLSTVAALAVLAGCASMAPAERADQREDLGVLVMAHGGSQQWNKEVLAAIEPLKAEHNIEVAFGMADAISLQQGVERLEARGARRIGVVRLFISGESFLERTEQILGLTPGAPQRAAAQTEHEGHAEGGHSMEFWRIDTQSSFAVSKQGLVEAPEMSNVLVERARTLSKEPQHEDVLILAHGPGDDAENERWLAHLNARAEGVRRALPFRTVRVETLREDWPEKRKDAEQRIRSYVEQASRTGRAIVIPFRVQGFGPYAEVLKGLDYASDGRGLVPDAGVTQWIEHQIATLESAEFRAAN
jgi:sirohydrochlorin cobaltochelatase